MQTSVSSIRETRSPRSPKADSRSKPTRSPSGRSPKLQPARSAPTSGEELLVQNEFASLCLLLNRRHGTMRVIDFRSGPSRAKRAVILETARREGVEKVFTLVERDEVRTWTRLGFSREGSIPGFYKRSDAWIMGAVVDRAGAYRDDDDDDDESDDADCADLDRAGSQDLTVVERTLARAKKLVKDASAQRAPGVMRIALASDADVRKAVQAATRSGRALTGFEPFGRGASRDFYCISARSAAAIVASSERQACFDNSYFELLVAPASEVERQATAAAVSLLCDRLKGDGAVSTFTLCPADDANFAASLLSAGFRRSAILSSHLAIGNARKAAIVFSKKLASSEA